MAVYFWAINRTRIADGCKQQQQQLEQQQQPSQEQQRQQHDKQATAEAEAGDTRLQVHKERSE